MIRRHSSLQFARKFEIQERTNSPRAKRRKIGKIQYCQWRYTTVEYLLYTWGVAAAQTLESYIAPQPSMQLLVIAPMYHTFGFYPVWTLVLIAFAIRLLVWIIFFAGFEYFSCVFYPTTYSDVSGVDSFSSGSLSFGLVWVLFHPSSALVCIFFSLVLYFGMNSFSILSFDSFSSYPHLL